MPMAEYRLSPAAERDLEGINHRILHDRMDASCKL